MNKETTEAKPRQVVCPQNVSLTVKRSYIRNFFLENMQPDDLHIKAHLFRQTAFTTAELILQPLTTFCIALGLWTLQVNFTQQLLDPLVFGFVLFFVSLLQALILVDLFLRGVARVYGMQKLSAGDTIWLADWQINPINVPSFLVINRPQNQKPQEILDKILSSLTEHKN